MPCSGLSGWSRFSCEIFAPFSQPTVLVSLENLLLFKPYWDGSGVGRIGLIDHDTVEVSNLHRQVLHLQSRVGVSKAVSLAASLAGINPSVEVWGKKSDCFTV